MQNADLLDIICCPSTQRPLVFDKQSNTLKEPTSGKTYPIAETVPVLLDDDTSAFSIEECINALKASEPARTTWLKKLIGLIPSKSININAKKNFKRFSQELKSLKKNPLVLIIGGGIVGDGMEEFIFDPEIRFVETDVYLGPRTQIICDAHKLPFNNESFDGLIIQAVLEHVADPYQCVSEIKRVLKPDGLVYAEIPFMQQVHEGAYDFTRFTHTGIRRLFRNFKEIDSNPVCGPAMALCWAYVYFLTSFTSKRSIRYILSAFGHLTGFWLKYFDYLLINKPGSYDAASGYAFMGKNSKETLSDKEIVRTYKGCVGKN